MFPENIKVLNNPKGKSVLITLLDIIKIICNYFKHLIKSYLAHYPQFKPPKIKYPILLPDNHRRHISTNQITELEPYTEHYTDMTSDTYKPMYSPKIGIVGLWAFWGRILVQIVGTLGSGYA